MQRCMIGSCSVCMVGESLPGRRRQRSSATSKWAIESDHQARWVMGCSLRRLHTAPAEVRSR
jgi:hypothetical protein